MGKFVDEANKKISYLVKMIIYKLSISAVASIFLYWWQDSIAAGLALFFVLLFFIV